RDDKNGALPKPEAKSGYRALGQGQFDYLHRLADLIREQDEILRDKDGRGIEAIGVLGSDTYDKLLVLQALRPILPNALYFTTDLDALYLDPAASAYTRNLLIASSFNLRLRPERQGKIPPFRSSYQTAGFLATRQAISAEGGDRPPPIPALLFEVGSS